ncbi:MAG: hypothetical protein OEY96_06670 [Gammaproteobacteria bacterium]|nr:hypothetical protein [Gammaproteobacteria bacterium]
MFFKSWHTDCSYLGKGKTKYLISEIDNVIILNLKETKNGNIYYIHNRKQPLQMHRKNNVWIIFSNHWTGSIHMMTQRKEPMLKHRVPLTLNKLQALDFEVNSKNAAMNFYCTGFYFGKNHQLLAILTTGKPFPVTSLNTKASEFFAQYTIFIREHKAFSGVTYLFLCLAQSLQNQGKDNQYIAYL